ncbi:MAG: L-2-hydroxyglutarate oxidase [Flavobacteriales bacterium]|nr:L-2-hydroxyglutarate oxidase [Flavobacteriales bacterium]
MKYDLIIVGGGIVGLAVALDALKKKLNLKVLVLEKEPTIAQHQSKHNSGVIHSGLYYKPGSLKAINCIKGYRKLLDFCQDENIKHEVCGKLVVATTVDEIPRLQELYHRGIANGLSGLKLLNNEEITEYEPFCRGVKALFVPQTGIVNFTSIAKCYAQQFSDLGGQVNCSEEVKNINLSGNKIEVITESRTWVGKFVVTCGGLHSDSLALNTIPNLPIRILPFRGEYYKLNPSAEKLVKNLIYPVPKPSFPFLGVHFTRMIDGGFECGPNAVLSFAKEGYNKYDFDLQQAWNIVSWPGFYKIVAKYWRPGMEEFYRSNKKSVFVKALQRLIPEIKADDLSIGDSGVRAQACDIKGRLLDDFDIRINQNIIHVCNAPSPAATSSLAIAEIISDRVLQIIN